MSAPAAEPAAGEHRASWLWLAAFFAICTLGELYILPTGLGWFARLAPPGFGATPMAAWFLAIFAGSLGAGAVGTLWGSTGHAAFFCILALLATSAAGILLALDRTTRRVEAAHADTISTPALSAASTQ